jgi:hypothetical protein
MRSFLPPPSSLKNCKSGRSVSTNTSASLDWWGVADENATEGHQENDYLFPNPTAVPVASSLELNDTLLANSETIAGIELTPLNCAFGLVSERKDIGPRTVRSICRSARKDRGADVTVVFAVRRAGCGACREHALQLNDIVNQLQSEPLAENFILRPRRVALVGVVKETGVDDAALVDFYEKYFKKNKLYKDPKWQIYNCMGARKLSVMRLLTQAARLSCRYRKKNIVNIPFGGDIFTKGGVLIFDKYGTLRYAYLESYGDVLPEEEIKAAIRAATIAQRPSGSEYSSSSLTDNGKPVDDDSDCSENDFFNSSAALVDFSADYRKYAKPHLVRDPTVYASTSYGSVISIHE